MRVRVSWARQHRVGQPRARRKRARGVRRCACCARACSSAQHLGVCAARASLADQRPRNDRPSAPVRNPSSDGRRAPPRRPARESARGAPRARLPLVRGPISPSAIYRPRAGFSVAVGLYAERGVPEVREGGDAVARAGISRRTRRGFSTSRRSQRVSGAARVSVTSLLDSTGPPEETGRVNEQGGGF